MALDFKNILHIFFPPSADAVRVQNIDALRPSLYTGAYCTSLLRFRDPDVRACMHEAKFHHNTKAITLLGTVLREYLLSISKTSAEKYVVIPIPLSSRRLRERGYNQVQEILKAGSTDESIASACTDVLLRTKHTPPQTSLTKHARKNNVTDVFGIRDKNTFMITKKNIILLDDVYTTGATMRAAKATLLPHNPASVTCLTLAH